MNMQIMLIFLPCAAALLLLATVIMQRRSYRKLKLQVGQLEGQLQAQAEQRPPECFSQDLAQVERSHKAPRQNQTLEMPDRYRYISAMARQGMSAAQIAAALQIGEAEALQIVNLSCLKRES